MSIEAIIDRYCEAWSDPDPAARAAALAEVWAKDARYTDPRADTYGAETLLAHIAGVLAQRPGARVVRTSAVQQHHGFARFAWRVIEADGTRLPEGLDIAVIGEDGRITQIIGFFGPLPSDAPPRAEPARYCAASRSSSATSRPMKPSCRSTQTSRS